MRSCNEQYLRKSGDATGNDALLKVPSAAEVAIAKIIVAVAVVAVAGATAIAVAVVVVVFVVAALTRISDTPRSTVVKARSCV